MALSKPPRRPRLVEVAQAAGVSVATVDRVLNARAPVRDDTADRVHLAIRELGYGRVLPEPPRSAPRTFDVLLQLEERAFYQDLHAAFGAVARELAERQVTCRIHHLQRIDAAEMARRVRKIALTSDGLALVPLEHPRVRQALGEAIEQGMPVVTLLSDLRQPGRLVYVGIDNRAAGRTAGYLMGRFLGRRAGRVAVTLETLSYVGQEEREMGFRSVLRERFPGLEVIEVVEREADLARSDARLRDLLRRDPELVGVYGAGGRNAVIGEAVRASGRAGEVVVVSHELTVHGRQLLIDGVFDAIIVQDCRLIAERALRALLAYYEGGDVADPAPTIEFRLHVCENLPFIRPGRPAC